MSTRHAGAWPEGEAGPRLVVHQQGGAELVVDLREGRTEVGRAPDAELRLAAPDVSGRHAELAWDGSALWLRDLGSRNGTAVDGRPVGTDWHELHDGDLVQWGSAEAEVRLPGAQLPAQLPSQGRAQGAPGTAPGGSQVVGSSRRVFVSHASEDKRLARTVVDELRRRGWDPWIDESGIPGGSSWAASIQSALRSSSAVVLLITSDSVAKEWVLDEVVAARNLRVPVVPAVLEHVTMPDEMQFLLQRTQSVDVTGLATWSSDDRDRRTAAAARLDSALLDVMERQGRLNPDRARMRLGKVLQVLGVLLVLGGFALFVGGGFTAAATSDPGSVPVWVLVGFGIFITGGLIGASGAAMVRSGRAKGL